MKFEQDDPRVRFTGLPAAAPDDPVTVIAAECESEPVQDMTEIVRKGRPRLKAWRLARTVTWKQRRWIGHTMAEKPCYAAGT